MALLNPRLPTLDEYDTTTVRNFILHESTVRPHAHSPFIITFCEPNLTAIDIQSFIHMGLRIVRFKMSHNITNEDRIKILTMLDDALKMNQERSGAPVWPIAIIMDIPSACIRTGFLKEEIAEAYVVIKDNWIIEITCDSKQWNQCEAKRICIDDPYTFEAITVGTEITINFGKIVMVCVKVIDKMTIECKVLRGDQLHDLEFVCIRGVKHKKPPFSKQDLALLEFAHEYKFDIISIHSVRTPHCLQKVREMFKDQSTPPLIYSSICEQEGLDNIDEILKFCDGIILAREFLAYEIDNKYQMAAIQLQVSAKCRKIGKPFFLSGNILESTLSEGTLSDRDVSDITNAVIQGSGFVIRECKDILKVLATFRTLNDICRYIETLKADANDIWRMIEEIKMPANAAEACILSCALAIKQTAAVACVVVTVTGATAIQLCHIAHGAIILAITRNPIVARQLQIYKGIVPIFYDEPTKNNWYEEIKARIRYAANYGLQYDILKYGSQYVVLMKSQPTGCFCDNISIWTVRTERKKRGFKYFNNY